MAYGEGNLRASIASAWEVFRDLKLGAERNLSPSYGAIGAAATKRMTYAQEWQRYLDRREFDIVLNDRSLLQFKFDLENERATLSYTFYECPIEALSYDAFLMQTYGTTDPDGDAYRDLYDEYLSSDLPIRPHVLPVRYDYSPALYSPGHPASHIHMGHDSTVRIGTRKILRPLSFALFVIRQCYSPTWQVFLAHRDAGSYSKQVSTELTDVPAKFFTANDAKEMHLA